MGREVKRVNIKFKWELNKVWPGYKNPLYGMYSYKCKSCKNGYSKHADALYDKWYGNAPFSPSESNSIPYKPSDTVIQDRAKRNYPNDSPRFVEAEAARLANLFNSAWCYHLSQEDVDALVAADRLYSLTHTFTPGEGWKPSNKPKPTVREVNEWSLTGMGHDSTNAYICIKARCEKESKEFLCPDCKGHVNIFYDEECKALCDEYPSYEPPKGDGYQLWETVSEGSPISPVFETPEELATWLVSNCWKTDKGITYEEWVKFIRGPGWAPTLVVDSNGAKNGVKFACDNQ